jgi:hypothetical protein
MRKTVLLGILAALLVVGLAAKSDAVLYTCQVNGVGAEGNNLYVYLTDDANGDFIGQRFLLGPASNTYANNLFATALDAIGSQYNVYANVDMTSFAVIFDFTYPYAGILLITDQFVP